jgi:hypothetical protein
MSRYEVFRKPKDVLSSVNYARLTIKTASSASYIKIHFETPGVDEWINRVSIERIYGDTTTDDIGGWRDSNGLTLINGKYYLNKGLDGSAINLVHDVSENSFYSIIFKIEGNAQFIDAYNMDFFVTIQDNNDVVVNTSNTTYAEKITCDLEYILRWHALYKPNIDNISNINSIVTIDFSELSYDLQLDSPIIKYQYAHYNRVLYNNDTPIMKTLYFSELEWTDITGITIDQTPYTFTTDISGVELLNGYKHSRILVRAVTKARPQAAATNSTVGFSHPPAPKNIIVTATDLLDGTGKSLMVSFEPSLDFNIGWDIDNDPGWYETDPYVDPISSYSYIYPKITGYEYFNGDAWILLPVTDPQGLYGTTSITFTYEFYTSSSTPHLLRIRAITNILKGISGIGSNIGDGGVILFDEANIPSLSYNPVINNQQQLIGLDFMVKFTLAQQIGSIGDIVQYRTVGSSAWIDTGISTGLITIPALVSHVVTQGYDRFIQFELRVINTADNTIVGSITKTRRYPLANTEPTLVTATISQQTGDISVSWFNRGVYSPEHVFIDLGEAGVSPQNIIKYDGNNTIIIGASDYVTSKTATIIVVSINSSGISTSKSPLVLEKPQPPSNFIATINSSRIVTLSWVPPVISSSPLIIEYIYRSPYWNAIDDKYSYTRETTQNTTVTIQLPDDFNIHQGYYIPSIISKAYGTSSTVYAKDNYDNILRFSTINNIDADITVTFPIYKKIRVSWDYSWLSTYSSNIPISPPIIAYRYTINNKQGTTPILTNISGDDIKVDSLSGYHYFDIDLMTALAKNNDTSIKIGLQPVNYMNYNEGGDMITASNYSYTIPDPPTIITYTATAPGEITVSWSHPISIGTDDPNITRLKYQYSLNGTLWEDILESLTSFTYNASLISSWPHRITLRTVTALGESHSTQPSNEFSLPTVDSYRLNVGNNKFNLGWLLNSDGGATIIRYEYSTDNGASWISTNTAQSVEYSTTGISLPHTPKVRAVTNVGTGPAITVSPAANIPNAPTSVSIEIVNVTDFRLTWAVNETGLLPITDFQYRLDESNTWINVGNAGATSVDYSMNDAVHTHVVDVRAVNALGPGSITRAQPTPVSTPNRPTNLTISVTSGVFTVSWDSPSNDGNFPITEYKYSKDGGTTWISAGVARSVTYNVSSVSLPHKAMVLAVNGIGDGEVAEANTLMNTPAAPTITGFSVINQQITLQWSTPASDGSPITGYEYSKDNSVSWIAIMDPNSTSITYADSGITLPHRGTIRAINSSGRGSIAETSGTINISSAVQNISISASNGIFTLGWNTPYNLGGSTLLRYEYSTNGGGSWASVLASTLSVTYAISSVTLPHSASARAVTEMGNGASATSPTLTTPAAPPNVALQISQPGTFSLTWSAPADSDLGGSTVKRYEYSIDRGTSWLSAGVATSVTYLAASAILPHTGIVRTVTDVNTSATAESTEKGYTKPNPATNVIIETTGVSGRYNVSWAASVVSTPAVTGYEYSADNGLTWQTTGGGTSVSYATSGISIPHNAKIRTVNGTIPSDVSISSLSVSPPAAPTDLVISMVSHTSLRIDSWTPPINTGNLPITGYEYSLDNGISWISSLSNTPPVTISVSAATRHQIIMRAQTLTFTAGGGTAASNIVNVPSAPVNLSITRYGAGYAKFIWRVPNDAGVPALTSYTVSYSGPSSGSISNIVGTTVDIPGISTLIGYTFTVNAVNLVGSGPTASSVATTPDTAAPAPPARTQLQRLSRTVAARTGSAGRVSGSERVSVRAGGIIQGGIVTERSNGRIPRPNYIGLHGVGEEGRLRKLKASGI